MCLRAQLACLPTLQVLRKTLAETKLVLRPSFLRPTLQACLLECKHPGDITPGGLALFGTARALALDLPCKYASSSSSLPSPSPTSLPTLQVPGPTKKPGFFAASPSRPRTRGAKWGGFVSKHKSSRRTAYAQLIVTTRLLYNLHDRFEQLSRMQRIYPHAW